MNAHKNTSLLSPEIREHLDQWNLRYPPDQKRSGVFEALRLVQEQNNGSLTTELMDAVAAYLNIPNIAVYEVATFYSLYNLRPVGRYIIDVCTNISCSLNGSDQIVEHLRKKLNVDFHETTADGKFTFREVECLGACIAPPVCQIDKQYYENLTPEKIDTILAALSDEVPHGK